ncbi:transposase [Mesorhizobium sp.]|uniref:transposase n=1 Tax=Mesorhizobium sp. TaxID=1871066 RepID=UPI00257DB424|nr:transposase [Mesorhizobium sp.]
MTSPPGLGLVPLQKSTGGKQRLGKTSKMGQCDIRRLLIIEAMAVVRWASRKGAPEGSGSRACCRRSRACSWPLCWPTRWRVASGPC